MSLRYFINDRFLQFYGENEYMHLLNVQYAGVQYDSLQFIKYI